MPPSIGSDEIAKSELNSNGPIMKAIPRTLPSAPAIGIAGRRFVSGHNDRWTGQTAQCADWNGGPEDYSGRR